MVVFIGTYLVFSGFVCVLCELILIEIELFLADGIRFINHFGCSSEAKVFAELN